MPKMYDNGKIIIGLALGIVILTFPFWDNIGRPGAKPPALVFPKDNAQCVEPASFMRKNHMKLLREWKAGVIVTRGGSLYITSGGLKLEDTFEKTCLNSKCHSDKKTFCDRCHNYIGKALNCWEECHASWTE